MPDEYRLAPPTPTPLVELLRARRTVCIRWSSPTVSVFKLQSGVGRHELIDGQPSRVLIMGQGDWATTRRA